MNTDLKNLINDKVATAFEKSYQSEVTDPEALGLMISNYFSWDGLKILETAVSALEDANFHAEAEAIQLMIDTLKTESN